jgi:hypothetical protein
MSGVLPPCRTDAAILLVAVKDEKGVWRFPDESPARALPGLHLDVKPLLPIGEQLAQRAVAALGADVARWLDVSKDIIDEITVPAADGEGRRDVATSTTVYVATYMQPSPPASPAPKEWPTFPDMIRRVPAGNGLRKPYVRAWQVYLGALSERTAAVTTDELRKRLAPEEGETH